MFVERKPVVPMLNEATNIQDAKFVRRKTASEIWSAIRMTWKFLYLQ